MNQVKLDDVISGEWYWVVSQKNHASVFYISAENERYHCAYEQQYSIKDIHEFCEDCKFYGPIPRP